MMANILIVLFLVAGSAISISTIIRTHAVARKNGNPGCVGCTSCCNKSCCHSKQK